jgi:hypothetical protein
MRTSLGISPEHGLMQAYYVEHSAASGMTTAMQVGGGQTGGRVLSLSHLSMPWVCSVHCARSCRCTPHLCTMLAERQPQVTECKHEPVTMLVTL